MYPLPFRLSCQAEVSEDMSVGISDTALSAEIHRAQVVGSRSVTPFIREITLRSMIRDELLYAGSQRRIDFWDGGRTCEDLFYVNELDELAKTFTNFSWQPVLSESRNEDQWNGPTGFVHLAARVSLLEREQHFSSCEFYICGPPPMLAATREMIAAYGVPETRVFFDDFGI